MAVPTITSIDKVSGPSRGGTLVEITGTNFRLTDPPPLTGPVPAAGPTVSVTFGGVICPLIRVASATRILVRTPPGTAGTSVAVQVQNLANNGTPIGGESATLAAAFIYALPGLIEQGPLVRLIKTLVLDMRKKIIPEVVHSWASDYYDASVSLTQLAIAKFPAIAVLGPSMPINRFYSINRGEDIEVSEDNFLTAQPPLTVDLRFVVLGISDKTIELLNLAPIVLDYFNRHKSISLQRDPANAGAGSNTYEMELSPYVQTIEISPRPSTSNVRQFDLGIEIRGFDIEGLVGFTDDYAIDKGVGVDEINTQVELT